MRHSVQSPPAACHHRGNAAAKTSPPRRHGTPGSGLPRPPSAPSAGRYTGRQTAKPAPDRYAVSHILSAEWRTEDPGRQLGGRRLVGGRDCARASRSCAGADSRSIGSTLIDSPAAETGLIRRRDPSAHGWITSGDPPVYTRDDQGRPT